MMQRVELQAQVLKIMVPNGTIFTTPAIWKYSNGEDIVVGFRSILWLAYVRVPILFDWWISRKASTIDQSVVFVKPLRS
eukprot:4867874-Amphidinium_carterae.1